MSNNTNRLFQLNLKSVANAVLLHFKGTEGLSQLYQHQLTTWSPEKIDSNTITEAPLSFSVASTQSNRPRLFNGIVSTVTSLAKNI